jgi:hypothetical protein
LGNVTSLLERDKIRKVRNQIGSYPKIGYSGRRSPPFALLPQLGAIVAEMIANQLQGLALLRHIAFAPCPADESLILQMVATLMLVLVAIALATKVLETC